MKGDCYRVTYIDSDKEEHIEFVKKLGDCAKFEMDNIVKVERAFIRTFPEVEKAKIKSAIETRIQQEKSGVKEKNSRFPQNAGICGLCYRSTCSLNCFAVKSRDNKPDKNVKGR